MASSNDTGFAAFSAGAEDATPFLDYEGIEDNTIIVQEHDSIGDNSGHSVASEAQNASSSGQEGGSTASITGSVASEGQSGSAAGQQLSSTAPPAHHQFRCGRGNPASAIGVDEEWHFGKPMPAPLGFWVALPYSKRTLRRLIGDVDFNDDACIRAANAFVKETRVEVFFEEFNRL